MIRHARRLERQARDHRARPACASSTPTTSSSATGCSRGLRVRLDRQGQHRRRASTTTARRPATRSREWNQRVTQLAIAAKAAVARALRPRARAHLRGRHLQRRLPDPLAAREPARPLRRRRRLGGHAVRRADGPNLFTYLPPALKNYPRYARRATPAAHDAMIGAGFAPGSEFLWDVPLRRLLGPHPAQLPRGARPRLGRRTQAGMPFCAVRHPRAATPTTTTRSRRPSGRGDRQGRQLTGKIGKPLVTLHGTLDTLLPISHRLRRLRPHGRRAGAGARTATTGSPTATTSTASTPRSPTGCGRCCRAPAARSTRSSAGSSRAPPPPDSQFVPKPNGGDVVNCCELAAGRDRAAAARPCRAARRAARAGGCA